MGSRTSQPYALALVLVAAYWPVTASAQPSCDDAQTLMYCTVEGGARTLNLCRDNDIITYAFGPTGGTPTLEMTRNIADVDYAPSVGADGATRESVTLFNGNYGYEMYISAPATGNDQMATDGGIIVRLPDGRTQTILCDAGTIRPTTMTAGLGQLGQPAEDTADITEDPLGHCLAQRTAEAPARNCLGLHRESDISSGTCTPATDPNNCWQAELLIWEDRLAARFSDALDTLTHIEPIDFIERLLIAQDTWLTARDTDCQISRRNPFVPDEGRAQCLAEYTADRITFLDGVVSGAEFDG